MKKVLMEMSTFIVTIVFVVISVALAYYFAPQYIVFSFICISVIAAAILVAIDHKPTWNKLWDLACEIVRTLFRR